MCRRRDHGGGTGSVGLLTEAAGFIAKRSQYMMVIMINFLLNDMITQLCDVLMPFSTRWDVE